MLKRILIGLGVLLVLLIAAAIVAPMVISVDTYRAKIEAAVQNATGRSFKIAGAMHFSLLPNAALEIDEVSLGNAPGARAPTMATFKQLVLEIGLLPLLHGDIEVRRFVLVDPKLNLEVDKNGVGNWVFAPPGAAGAPAPSGKPAASPPPEAAVNPLAGREIHLGEVRLDNGTIAYRDDRTSGAYTLDKIGMTVTLPDMRSPFAFDGAFDWNGQTVKLGLKGTGLGGILAGGGAPLAFTLDSKPIAMSFDGKLGKLQPATLDGAVKLAVPSVRALAAWAGSPIAGDNGGFGPLSINGKLALAGNRIAFTDAAVALDDMKGKGEVVLQTGGARPMVTARLDLDHLDLNTYASKSKPAAAPAAPGPAAAPGAAKSPAAKSSSDWSDAPIDFSPLKSADADIAFSVGAIEVQKIKIGKSSIKATLKDGLLAANLAELNLYEGKGQGTLEVDGRTSVPAIKAAFNLAGLQAEPFLKDAANVNWLSGKGNFELTAAASGKSQRALVSALNGNGKFAFRDGAIKGLNIGAMVRNISSAFLDAQAGKAQETDFSSLTGTYTIANGILTNKDMEMVSPLLRVTGAGTVDMPKRTVNYKITPKVVASAKGQGGSTNAGGVSVPIAVTGSWDDLHYTPDLAGSAQSLIKSLIGNGKSGGGSGGGIFSNPQNILKNLFGK